jgi:hypothetical protein
MNDLPRDKEIEAIAGRAPAVMQPWMALLQSPLGRRHEVPPASRATAALALHCTRCDKLYWPGSHVPHAPPSRALAAGRSGNHAPASAISEPE